MLNGIKDVKIKFGPVLKQFSPDRKNSFKDDLLKVKNEIGYLVVVHSNFLTSDEDDLIDVSFDDIEHIKQKLTKIQRKYFVDPD